LGGDVERPLGEEHALAQHQIEALRIAVDLNLRDQVALHLADFLIAPRGRVVLEFTGLALEFTLLVAQSLLRLRTIGFGHHRAFFLQFIIACLQIVLHREQFAAAGRKLVLERLHRGLGLRCFLQKLLEIDHAHFYFRARRPGDHEPDQAQAQERNAAIESRHVDL
jgi:hypothetical protein